MIKLTAVISGALIGVGTMAMLQNSTVTIGPGGLVIIGIMFAVALIIDFFLE